MKTALTFYPSGAGLLTQQSPNIAVPNWQAVADPAAADLASYLSPPAVSHVLTQIANFEPAETWTKAGGTGSIAADLATFRNPEENGVPGTQGLKFTAGAIGDEITASRLLAPTINLSSDPASLVAMWVFWATGTGGKVKVRFVRQPISDASFQWTRPAGLAGISGWQLMTASKSAFTIVGPWDWTLIDEIKVVFSAALTQTAMGTVDDLYEDVAVPPGIGQPYRDLYSFAFPAKPRGYVQGVRLEARAGEAIPGLLPHGTFQFLASDGRDTALAGVPITSSSAFAKYTLDLPRNPVTGHLWRREELARAQFGSELIYTGGAMPVCSLLSAIVTLSDPDARHLDREFMRWDR